MTKKKKDMLIKILYNDIDTLTNILLAENLIEDGPIFNHSVPWTGQMRPRIPKSSGYWKKWAITLTS